MDDSVPNGDICGECEKEKSTIHCKNCKENYCDPCCTAVHQKGRRARHTQFIPTSVLTDGEKIDYNVTNGMAVIVTDLTFARWGDGTTVPPHMQATVEVGAAVAPLLRQTGDRYVDPDPVTLDAANTLSLPWSISRRVQSEEVEELEQRMLREHSEAVKKKMQQIWDKFNSAPLNPVHAWRRAAVVLKQPVLFGAGNTVLEDVPTCVPANSDLVTYLPRFVRGIYSDAPFLLALSHVVSKRTTLSHLFAATDHADVGMYTFQFYQMEDMFHAHTGWQCVTVDDQIPCNGDMHPIFGGTRDPMEMFGILAEKAYAKFLGSYTYLHGGDHARTMVHLTGGTTFTYQWHPNHIDTDAQSVLWWRLKENAQHGLFSSVMRSKEHAPEAGGTGEPEAPDPEKTALRLVELSEYVEWNDGAAIVVNAVEIPIKLANELIRDEDSLVRYMEPMKLLKLRTLWGHTWSGDWSPQSHLWNREIRAYLNATHHDENVFWIKVEDFMKNFDTFTTTQSIPGGAPLYYDSLEGQPEGHAPLHADQFLITVGPPGVPVEDNAARDDPSSLVVELYLSQPDKDSIYQDYRDGADLPEMMDIFLFYRPDGQIQGPFNDNEGEYEVIEDNDSDDDVYVDQKVAKQPYWMWPENDMMTVTEVPSNSRFVQVREARLPAGRYVAVVQQSYHKDDVNYCFTIKTRDELDTGYTASVQSIGTVANPTPVTHTAPVSNIRPQTPRKVVDQRIEDATAVVREA